MRALLVAAVFALGLVGCAEDGEEAGTTQGARTHTVATTTALSVMDVQAVGQGPDDVEGPLSVDLDGRIDCRGRFIFSEGVLSLVISGRGQAFEPVPVNRLDNDVVGVVHAVDVFFVVLGEAEIESEVDLQIAMRSEFDGVPDRAPDEGWIRVPFA